MRALSIRQPWAWAILHAGKRVENRDWRFGPSWRGTFLLHASKGLTRFEYASAAMGMYDAGLAWPDGTILDRAPGIAVLPREGALTRGAIVGRARLTGAVRLSDCPSDPWAIPGALGLVLADVERLAVPIPFKGALGFFEVPDGLLSGATWEPAGGR